MRILSSTIMILGLLVSTGGIVGLAVGNPSGPMRLLVGGVICVVAFALRPKPAASSGRVVRDKVGG